MLRVILAALAAIAVIATTFFATPVSAQDRSYERGNRAYRYDRAAPQQYYGAAPRVHGRRDPSSYDGYRTGQPRTCGHDFFQYDDRGTPVGPYCN